MARGRGEQKGRRAAPAPDATRSRDAQGERDAEEIAGGQLNPIPDLVRKALSLGFSGFFLTESTIRKAIGDSLPKDWVDFAVQQSERARAEFLERLSYEIGRSLDNVDLAAALTELLEGRTLEVHAEIRLGPRDGEPARRKLEVAASDRERS